MSIAIRPSPLSEISLTKLTAHGFTLCAIVETRAGNFQPWLKPPAIFPITEFYEAREQ